MSTHNGQVTGLRAGTMFLLFAFFSYPGPQPWDRPSLILNWLLKSFSNWSLPFQTSFHTTVGLIFLKYSFDHFICVIKSLQWFSTVHPIKSKGLSLTFKTLYKMVLFFLPFPSAPSSMASEKIPHSQQFSRISKVSNCEIAQSVSAFWEIFPGLGTDRIQEYIFWKEGWWWPTNCERTDPWWSQEGLSSLQSVEMLHDAYTSIHHIHSRFSLETILKRTELNPRKVSDPCCLPMKTWW